MAQLLFEPLQTPRHGGLIDAEFACGRAHGAAAANQGKRFQPFPIERAHVRVVSMRGSAFAQNTPANSLIGIAN